MLSLFFLIYPLDFFFFSFALWVWLVFFLHGVEPITFLPPPRDQQVETPVSAQSGVSGDGPKVSAQRGARGAVSLTLLGDRLNRGCGFAFGVV